MIKFQIIMKHLTELDTIYSEVFQRMTIDERIDYCESLIATTESFLLKNDIFLNKNIKEKSQDIIRAANDELNDLKNLQKTPKSKKTK